MNDKEIKSTIHENWSIKDEIEVLRKRIFELELIIKNEDK